MKNLKIASLALLIVSANANAIDFASVSGQEIRIQDKVSVKPEDLPQPIKTTLATDVYSGWEITEAFIITKEDKTQFYEISLKNGSETAKINLDKDGRKVE